MTVDAEPLRAPARLRALQATNLLDTPPEEAFDRFTRLAARIFHAPLALVNLVDDQRQFSKSCFAPPEWRGEREASLEDSFCANVIVSREPLLVEDAAANPVTASSAMVTELGIRSYLGVPLTTEDGQVLGTLCVSDFVPRRWDPEQVEALRDLAVAVMTEIELRRLVSAGEERYEALVESIRDYGIVRLDPDGRIRTWNSGAEQATGVPRDQALGRSFSFLYRGEDVERGEPERVMAEARERGRAEREGWRVRGDGSLFWGLDVLTPIRGAGRSLRGFVSVFRDRTEQKRAEERERELIREQASRLEAEAAERRISEILEGIADAFVAMDRESAITYVNARAEELLGLPRDRVLGRSFWEVLPEFRDADVQEAARRARAARVTVDVDRRWPRAPDTWLHLHFAPTADGVAVYLRDITQRKRAEEALAASEAELSAMIRGMGDVVLVLDAEGRYRKIAPTAAPLRYRPPDELLGRPLHDVLPSDAADYLVDRIRSVLASGQTEYVEYSQPIGTEEAWFLGAVSPMSEDQVVWVGRDITRQRRMEEALRESEARFRQLAEHVEEVFWVSTADFGEVLYINPAFERVWGRPVEDIYRDPLAFLADVHPEDLALVREAVAEAANRPIALDCRIRHPEAGTRWIHVRSFPVQNEAGQTYRIAALLQDVTAQKLAEMRLRHQHDLLDAIIEGTPAAIFLKDREGRYQLVNGAYLEMTGLTRDQVLGRDDSAFFPPELAAKFRADDRRVIESGQTLSLEESVPSAGEARHFLTLKTPLADDSGQIAFVLGIAHEVTEQKRAAEALRSAKEEAETANRAKSEFLSRMSHELRTPLNAILGFGQLLALDARSEEDQESVEQILKAGRHLLALIDEVLDIARIEAGQASLSIESVPVREAVQASVDLVRLSAGDRGITLEAGSALSSVYSVRADQQRLRQVLLNLLSNAIKYNRPRGAVTLSCGTTEEDRLRISVRDTGYGIPAEQLDRLFVPFERLGAEQSSVEGTGLGLALSRGLVEAMGGTLGVESVEGEGSCFWVELPLAPSPGGGRPGEEPSAPGTPTRTVEQTNTVLLVEDNLDNVRLIERVLQRWPHVRLIAAMQGSLGLDLAREHRPDLILLDVDLPDLPGDQVLLQLQGDAVLADTPVVVISADAVPSRMERLLGLGAQAYVTKPFDVRELLRVIDDHLPQRGGSRAGGSRNGNAS